MSWLAKEVLDALEHAGYVAVPKERVETFTHVVAVPDAEMRYMIPPRDRADYERALHRQMAIAIGEALLEKGFLNVHLFDPDKEKPFYRHRAEVNVLKPR